MIPFWIAISPSKTICELLIRITINDSNRFEDTCVNLPHVTAANVSLIFMRCPNLKSVTISECNKFSPFELMQLLNDDQEINCTLDKLNLFPTYRLYMTRDATIDWIQAMLYFKEIFQSRNSNFKLKPQVCSCGEGLFEKYGPYYTCAGMETSVSCERCDEILPECCVACVAVLGIKTCARGMDCGAYGCADCVCQQCKRFYCSFEDNPIEMCSVENCNLILCGNCGMERCNECRRAFCPDHLWLNSCMNTDCPDEFICTECQVQASSCCRNCRSTFCPYCIGEHKCQKAGSNCGSMWDF
jgi:hypothetical protein